MSGNAPSTQKPLIRWISPEGKALARDVIEENVSEWPDRLYEPQVCSLVRTLDRVSQVVRMPTGGGKTGLFAAPVLMAQYLNKHPSQQSKPIAKKPVAIVIVPLIELANNHVSGIKLSSHMACTNAYIG